MDEHSKERERRRKLIDRAVESLTESGKLRQAQGLVVDVVRALEGRLVDVDATYPADRIEEAVAAVLEVTG